MADDFCNCGAIGCPACVAYWRRRAAARKGARVAAPDPGPCPHEGPVVAWCPRGDEARHVRQCLHDAAGWDTCVRGRVAAGDSQSCASCHLRPAAAGPEPAAAGLRVVIDHGAGGLGDGLLGLCAVAGLKADHPGRHVTYRPGAAAIEFVRQFHGYDALALRQSPTHDGPLPDGAVQLNAGYKDEFRTQFAKPRWERYADACGASRCVIPGLRDGAGLRAAAAALAGRVILAPFSTEPAREWSVQHYLHLSRLLTGAGYKVAVIHTDARKLAPFRNAERWHDLTAERLTGAFLSAVAVVGPDSGPAHLGGILGVPTVVLGGYTPVGQIFGFYPRVTCLQGPLDCTGCCSQAPIDRRCRTSCAAIQLVSPEAVAAAVRKAVAG